MNLNDDIRQIRDSGIIAVLRGISRDVAHEVAEAAVDGGVTAVEVTADTPGVLEIIESLSMSLADRSVLIGVGTVLDATTARSVLLAGAEFVVTPAVNENVIRTCNRYGATVITGALTPTEILAAHEAGSDAIKIFPAASVGPGHLSNVGGPFGHIPLIPSGGVTLDNAPAYIGAGAIAVGIGSDLVSDAIVESRDFEAVTTRARQFVHTVSDARSPTE